MTPLKETPLHEQHLLLKAKMMPFAGWDMPLHYGSQSNEHLAVRQSAGLFDVSHMQPIDVIGKDALAFLSHVLANNPQKMTEPGQALYSCMLNEQGGIIDDLIVYYLGPNYYGLIVNAGCADKDWNWLLAQSKAFSDLQLHKRENMGLLALQGPAAHDILKKALPEAHAALDLKPFSVLCLPTTAGASHSSPSSGSTSNTKTPSPENPSITDFRIATTGYTGELGFEILMPATQAVDIWTRLLKAGAKPIGLGARDSLRLEAGLNLYGTDMDERVTPLESNLGWTIALSPPTRDFIGRAAVEQQKADGPPHQLLAVKLMAKGVLRAHQKIVTQKNPQHVVGEITSGTFSPLLQASVGFARITRGAEGPFAVEIRHEFLPVELTKPPIWRRNT